MRRALAQAPRAPRSRRVREREGGFPLDPASTCDMQPLQTSKPQSSRTGAESSLLLPKNGQHLGLPRHQRSTLTPSLPERAATPGEMGIHGMSVGDDVSQPCQTAIGLGASQSATDLETLSPLWARLWARQPRRKLAAQSTEGQHYPQDIMKDARECAPHKDCPTFAVQRQRPHCNTTLRGSPSYACAGNAGDEAFCLRPVQRYEPRHLRKCTRVLSHAFHQALAEAEPPHSGAGLADLPAPLLLSILGGLELKELATCARLGSHWTSSAHPAGWALGSDALWRQLCQQHWATKAPRFRLEAPGREASLRAAWPDAGWREVFRRELKDGQRQWLGAEERRSLQWRACEPLAMARPNGRDGPQRVAFSLGEPRPPSARAGAVYEVSRLDSWEWLLSGKRWNRQEAFTSYVEEDEDAAAAGVLTPVSSPPSSDSESSPLHL